MNVLLFVTSMIMVMAMLTYGRLQTYRSFSLTQNEFNRFMTETERGDINKAAMLWYENSLGERRGSGASQAAATPSTTSSKSQGAPSTSTRSQALSRLSFATFIDNKKKEAHQKEYPQIRNLAQKLIYVLYRNQPFFKEMEAKNPDFVNSLLNALMVADTLSDDNKIKRASELANLNLGDEDLNHVFYEMLQGTAQPGERLTKPKTGEEMPKLEFQAPEDKGEPEDKSIEGGRKEEYYSGSGYYSLLDFITLRDSTKVRVYLAPKMLLMAIFDDPGLVDSIIAARNDLYKKVSSNEISDSDASKSFEDMFKGRIDPNLSEILDFSVSSTNPAKYRLYNSKNLPWQQKP